MKFWSKYWKLVSKKYLIFGSILFVVVFLLNLVEVSTKVKVTFDESSVTAATKKYSMNIPYEMVEYIELVDLPDRGEVIKGSDDMSARTGTWDNEAWGEYSICANLMSSNCIVVHLNDDRIFVFSNKSNEQTAEDFETLQSYLNQ